MRNPDGDPGIQLAVRVFLLAVYKEFGAGSRECPVDSYSGDRTLIRSL
jgi:hypothetical protein